ncbi:hypothetical protein NPIL_215381 [Nephila pilipes]|uniref:Uncharacterized protein n=1 Tax=Nephila pilipes TaxID=299642 RepID=A0A8X6IDI0_NEPPI|nr:hypothetical protein NPIL_215381 [Nephila pilipes]
MSDPEDDGNSWENLDLVSDRLSNILVYESYKDIKGEGEVCIEVVGIPPFEQCEEGTTCTAVGDKNICVRDDCY